MNSKYLNIILADDDLDDCIFFKKVLDELPQLTHLTIVRDGEELMDYLSGNSGFHPQVLFLDLNMPRKTGIECLTEIKGNEKLKDLIVVMFSTSYPREKGYEQDLINTLIKMGAFHFIRKQDDLIHLKEAVNHALTLVSNQINIQYKIGAGVKVHC